jgi:hypothetical protein|eukprot:COSAG01_NODE_168_length_23206_cov_14.301467_27_plen_131_part_00
MRLSQQHVVGHDAKERDHHPPCCHDLELAFAKAQPGVPVVCTAGSNAWWQHERMKAAVCASTCLSSPTVDTLVGRNTNSAGSQTMTTQKHVQAHVKITKVEPIITLFNAKVSSDLVHWDGVRTAIEEVGR